VTPSATQSLLERITFIQHTHYGGFWDFTSSSTPTDTAYTNQQLGVHTDTTYLSNPCGLQMFHLLSHTDGTGGESLFVDGYAAAAHLRDTKPAHYRILNRQKILCHASGNNEVGEISNRGLNSRGNPAMYGGLSQDLQLIDGPRSGAVKPLIKPRRVPSIIRWNNDDRDAQSWRSLKAIEQWYNAAREWTKILKMKEFEIKIQLKPGQPIIFDNWRYLHGRTAFSGKRRICGGYSRSPSISSLHPRLHACLSPSPTMPCATNIVSPRIHELCLSSPIEE
jgi:trimethyllysine dioxygenase